MMKGEWWKDKYNDQKKNKMTTEEQWNNKRRMSERRITK